MRVGAIPLLVCLSLALAGCGLGPGREQAGGVELRVTRDFGHERVGSERIRRVREDETVMRLLRSRFPVKTRYGGRFVQAIRGISGKGATGRSDWFYFVNGVEASVGAAEYTLSPGDVVQWDYRRWDATMRVPAIVGAFPQPFTGGVRGKRLPVRVECEDPGSAPCAVVKRSLLRRGVTASGATLGVPGGSAMIRMLVGRWRALRSVAAAATVADGPERSGVFARFRGDKLELLDPGGGTARVAGRGTGLVAAVSPAEREILWLVTGVDAGGVARAARALDRRTLRDAYAVAVGARGAERLPVEDH
jgi:hypothetical protein